MSLPTITVGELSAAIQSSTTGAVTKKVLEGLLNDHMSLLYGQETDYTTGKRILPAETTIEDVDTAAADTNNAQKLINVFLKISETYKKGDLTPQSTNDGTWDPKLTPVLVLVTGNL